MKVVNIWAPDTGLVSVMVPDGTTDDQQLTAALAAQAKAREDNLPKGDLPG